MFGARTVWCPSCSDCSFSTGCSDCSLSMNCLDCLLFTKNKLYTIFAVRTVRENFHCSVFGLPGGFEKIIVLTPTHFVKILKTLWNSIQTFYHYISFDAKFYDDFKFSVKKIFHPRIFEISAKKEICVGGSQNFCLHINSYQISVRKIYISCIWIIYMSHNFKLTRNWIMAHYSPQRSNFEKAPPYHHLLFYGGSNDI